MSMLHSPAWKAKVQELSDIAHAKLDASVHPRIEMATAICLHGNITFDADGTCHVLSSDKTQWYLTNGTCDCDATTYHPQGYVCKHMYAKRLALKALDLCADTPEVAPVPCEAPPAPLPDPEYASSIPRQHIQWIKGKPFVCYVGLLQMAHARGLLSLDAHWTYNDDGLSLAEATAVFPDNKVFKEAGDATPANVTEMVRPHFRRISLTRAKARALRDALGVELVSVEELAEA